MVPSIIVRERVGWLVAAWLLGCGGFFGLRTDYYEDSDDGGVDASGDALDASTSDGQIGPPSCEGLAPTCGPTDTPESCCTSLEVKGGSFKRGTSYIYSDAAPEEIAPATVSDFKLDKYKVTVGRFRKFVAASAAGWYPKEGAGRHTHLAKGGVTQSTNNGDFLEPGWVSGWAIPNTSKGWYDYVHGIDCEKGTSSYDEPPTVAKEPRPVNCVPWLGAYAFCIWDGGFLPTDVEYNYAAVGGAEQRYHPWSSPPNDVTIDWRFASYGVGWYDAFQWMGCYGDPAYMGILHPCGFGDITIPGSKQAGNARWGHADLVGVYNEYVLDCYAPFPSSCVDCGSILPGCKRTLRGSPSGNPAEHTRGIERREEWYAAPFESFRCARVP